MNSSIPSLTGPELEELYLSDKSNDHLKQPDNLKLLLTHILSKDMRDLSSSDLEILDYCQRELHPEELPDERKMQFLRDKYSLIADEKMNQRRFRKMAAVAASAVILLVGGVLGFGGIESEAGIFDWVRSIFVRDEGEQLVIGTPDATMHTIEYKKGHLPKKLPNLVFHEKENNHSSTCTIYTYSFYTPKHDLLYFQIEEYFADITQFNILNEIIADSEEEIIMNNQKYYYCENISNNSIIWTSNNSLYRISGSYNYTDFITLISYYDH